MVLHPEQAQSGRGGKTWGVMDMRRALRERLAPYKIPQEMKVVQELPRNAMGKSEWISWFCFRFGPGVVLVGGFWGEEGWGWCGAEGVCMLTCGWCSQ